MSADPGAGFLLGAEWVGDALEEVKDADRQAILQKELSRLCVAHSQLSTVIDTLTRNRVRAYSSDSAETTLSQLTALREQRASLDRQIAHVQRQLATPDGACSPVRTKDKARTLLPRRHSDHDFFLADLIDYAIKDDGVSMEVPLYSLSTKPDLTVWSWTSRDGERSVKVYPSVLGRATIFDKDILIYVVSQIAEGLNRGREDAHSRTARFTVYDFIVTTNRSLGGRGYKLLHDAFERLAGTRITTDIRTGGVRVREGFGIIDSWRIVERDQDERMIAVEVTLSRWLYNAVQAMEVLTLHPGYFHLRQPLVRRLYELARKHVGNQPNWLVGLDLLHSKSGSRTSRKDFARKLRDIVSEDPLPEYHIELAKGGAQVLFRPRHPGR